MRIQVTICEQRLQKLFQQPFQVSNLVSLSQMNNFHYYFYHSEHIPSSSSSFVRKTPTATAVDDSARLHDDDDSDFEEEIPRPKHRKLCHAEREHCEFEFLVEK